MRRAVVLPAPLRLGEAGHHLLNTSARTTLEPLVRPSVSSPGPCSNLSTAILNVSGSASCRRTSTSGVATPRTTVWKMSDAEVTPTLNKLNDPLLRAPNTRKPNTAELAKAFTGYPWTPDTEILAKPLPRILISQVKPRNALQLQDLAYEDSLAEYPRTSVGEPIKDLFGHDDIQTLKASQQKRGADTIDEYIEYARIGESSRHGLGEGDPWLESLLVVKQRFTDMGEARICLGHAQTMYPVLRPLIEDATEAIDALKKQTIEFYRDAYSKWWARVPPPPGTPSQTLKIARAICEGKHGATEAAASFLIGLIPRIDAERELFCDFCHPSHGSPFIPFRSAREKSVRFAPTPPPNFTPLPFLTSRRAEMIDT